MSELISVGVAELKASDNSCILASFGLGSCVAVAIFDPLKKVGGLAHVMLPESRGKDTPDNPGKFADTAVRRLVEELVALGARQRGLKCKIAGGSQMFDMPSTARENGSHPPRIAGQIGSRNVQAVKAELEALGIPLVAEDTGGNYGRTVKFDTSTGRVEISSINHGRTSI